MKLQAYKMNENEISEIINKVTNELSEQLKKTERRLQTTASFALHKIPENKSELAGMIDHTLLKPEATEEQIVQLCAEAKEHHFASVCVNPVWAALCAQELHGSDVMVCSVVGFPLGANTTRMKSQEAAGAVADGADEIDMVIHVGKLKSGELLSVYTDIHEVVRAADGRHVKVIIETCLLTDEEKVIACTVAKLAGAHFVKTSTGFNKAGATIQDVDLMRKVVGDAMGVKAAGGIRDYEKAMEMIRAGANRIGASASVAIVGR